jgi:polar amino acid transport system substrate-binding protein
MLLAALAIAALTAGCSGSGGSPSAGAPSTGPGDAALVDLLPDDIKSAGEVKVGINAIFPPMEYKEPGKSELSGFDVDLADAIGAVLGIKVVYDDQEFDQLINSVTTGRVDMVISGMSDNKKRQEKLDFIDYFNSGTQVFTLKSLEDEIKGLEDLSGKTVALSASTDYVTTLKDWSDENLVANGKAPIEILAVDSSASARLQMQQGRAVASAAGPDTLAWIMTKEAPGDYVTVGPLLDPNPYGIAFDKGSGELRDAVLTALKKVIADGTYGELLAKWGLESAALTEPVVNGAEH